MTTPLQVDDTETSVTGMRSEPGTRPVERPSLTRTLHWPEYAMEAALLALFMLSACAFTVVLQLPDSAVRQAITSSILRRALTGIAMGVTAIALIYSPWGQRSGAHLNPSVTLTFLRLGKIAPWDALFYVLFQFLGGAAGVMSASLLIGPALRHSAVNYAVTQPGPRGSHIAFIAEVA